MIFKRLCLNPLLIAGKFRVKQYEIELAEKIKSQSPINSGEIPRIARLLSQETATPYCLNPLLIAGKFREYRLDTLRQDVSGLNPLLIAGKFRGRPCSLRYFIGYRALCATKHFAAYNQHPEREKTDLNYCKYLCSEKFS